ncbi:hypothetical protein WK43_29560 [Burkholderia ubonensis]|nr:hypothetical protein WM29_30415 [Burkholderia ubonensis]KVS39472.1 hypothetical protein WK38_33170 [Burkholderia ubonensis]KVS49267.1 hypothetical protein WK37_05785 [Burkholderia ubonensis]KVS72861.1 hypothetical protein WK42_23185 [Burkholderia ubonensis]KVS79322.1 hypothetical protein WK44_03645 [Burkholderia ubonensis]
MTAHVPSSNAAPTARRRRPVRCAAETGKVALAARLVRDSADATGNRPDLALYLPIGTAGDAPPAGDPQRAATAGFVYAGLDAQRLFDLSPIVPLGLRAATDLSAVELGLAKQPAPGGVRDQLSGMHRLIDATVASVRRIAADLRPVMLDDLGLVPAIEWLANDFTHRYGIEVERHIDPADTIFTSAGATALFRIVQEALTNVARHADATRVVLTLKVDDGYCMLRIADNGHGHGAPERPQAVRDHPSFGLIGIRERAHMLDGTVTIDSEPDKGFTITVALPLHAIQQRGVLS